MEDWRDQYKKPDKETEAQKVLDSYRKAWEDNQNFKGHCPYCDPPRCPHCGRIMGEPRWGYPRIWC